MSLHHRPQRGKERELPGMGDRALARRLRTPEMMDQPDLDAEVHSQALRGLGRINRLSRSASILWPGIASVASRHGGRVIRVLDLASGGGDVPIHLARRAHRRGVSVRIEGCDVSEMAIEFAARAARHARVDVPFVQLDAVNDPLPEGFDVVTCSLFLHHLSDEQAVRLLRRMADAARSTILVNDLLRSRLGYALAWTGCRLLSRSPIVHHDGPASVRSAFRLAEARDLAERAGLQGVGLSRRWPRRFLLSWSHERP
jgi:2-polyprenyl-3-methyl-5-hydroxy-6-metoxy-1,4-benzoquinol methylase